MTGPLDQAGQTLMDAADVVAGASTHLALLNADMDRATALIKEVTPNGFAELHDGLAKVKESSHLLMQLCYQVSSVIGDRGVDIATQQP